MVLQRYKVISREAKGFPYLIQKTKIWDSERAKYGERLGDSDALRASFCTKLRVEGGEMRGYDFLSFPCISCNLLTLSQTANLLILLYRQS